MAATKLTADELDKLDDAKLAEELAKAKDELFKLRFQSATGQLERSGRLRSVKKDIARIYTILRERELGIRQAPGSAEWRMAPVTASPTGSATRRSRQ